MANPTPVFVGGCDRSGTTLMGALLGGHPNILCVPEGQFILEVYAELAMNDQLADREAATKLLGRHRRFMLWNVKPPTAKSHTPNPLQGFVYSDLIREVVECYAKKVGRGRHIYWVDHVPTNIKTARLLLDLFPTARFLHIVRDGRAVLRSLKAVQWGPNSVDRIASSWVDYLAHGLAMESALGERIIRVSYEELVCQPEETLTEVCEFLNLDFRREMLSGEGLILPEFYKGDERLIGDHPDPERITAWARELSPREIELFESIAGALLQHLGYTTRYFPLARGIRSRERLISLLMLPFETFGNYLSAIRLFLATLPRQKG